MKFGKSIRHNWLLADDIIFLNHGSFGATPKKVLQSEAAWNELIEREPVRFFVDEYETYLHNALYALGSFLDCDASRLAFIDNATTGVNTVLRSLQPSFGNGDGILYLSHVYPAVKNTLSYISKVTGAMPVEVRIPAPVTDKESILKLIDASAGDNIKLAVIDHIASPTGIVFPVKEITELLKRKGIPVLIDGAHAPGMLDLDVNSIGADWYVGNCHKWMFASKGCAFLYTSEGKIDDTVPLNISLGYDNGYRKMFDWTGTKNPVHWLTITDAIDFYNSFGKENIINYNRGMIREAVARLVNVLKTEAAAPYEMTGNLLAFRLNSKAPTHEDTDKLRKTLLGKYHIEVPVILFDNSLWIRVSAQIYNDPEEYTVLADALTFLGFGF